MGGGSCSKAFTMDWINCKTPPENGQYVIAGNANSRWVAPDCLYTNGKFLRRNRANVGGRAAFQQYDREKPPWERLDGFECFPTHWMPQPLPPV